jgi:hypothetical protein
MPNYKCNICKRTWSKKTDYDRHLNRKNPCKPNYENDDENNDQINILRNILNEQANEKRNMENIMNNLKNDNIRINAQLKDKINDKENMENKINDLKKYNIYINAQLREKNARIIDIINENNNINTQLKEINKRMTELTNINTQLEEKINDLTNDNINAQLNEKINDLTKKNIQINAQLEEKDAEIIKFKNNKAESKSTINIVAFGNENYHKILNKNEIVVLLKKGMKCIYNILEYVHFGNKYEYRNIYIKNIKNKYITIYNGNNWIINKIDDIIVELLDNLIYSIDYMINEIEEIKLDTKDKNKIEQFLNDIKDDNFKKQVIDNIIIILYNNRNIILKK